MENTMMLLSVYDNDLRTYGEHLLFLYRILGERKPHQAISHRKMPTFEQHREFVSRRPYKEWLIAYNNGKVGSVYLSEQDEIGLFVLEEHQNKGLGGEILDCFLSSGLSNVYYANINPLNFKSINFFKKHGFEWHKDKSVNRLDISQVTYIKA